MSLCVQPPAQQWEYMIRKHSTAQLQTFPAPTAQSANREVLITSSSLVMSCAQEGKMISERRDCGFVIDNRNNERFLPSRRLLRRPSGSDSWEKMKTCFQRTEPVIKQRHELAGLFHTVTLSAAGCRAGVAWGRWQDPGVKALIGARFSTNVPTRSVSRAADTDKRVCRQSSHVSETTSTLLVLRRPVR